RREGCSGMGVQSRVGGWARCAVRRPGHGGCGMTTLPQQQGTRRIGLLQDLVKAGALRTLDHALAQSLRRLDPATPDSVLAAAALASLAVASGHAGFDPAEPQRLVDAAIDWPTPDAWREALEGSRWVA